MGIYVCVLGWVVDGFVYKDACDWMWVSMCVCGYCGGLWTGLYIWFYDIGCRCVCVAVCIGVGYGQIYAYGFM